MSLLLSEIILLVEMANGCGKIMHLSKCPILIHPAFTEWDTGCTTVASVKSLVVSVIWILKLYAFAAACMMILSAHVPYLHIFCKYCSHDCSGLLSIKRSGSGTFIKCWIARPRICIYQPSVPYSCWLTLRKTQFPSPITFTGVNHI